MSKEVMGSPGTTLDPSASGREDAPSLTSVLIAAYRCINESQNELQRRWYEARDKRRSPENIKDWGAGWSEGLEVAYRNAFFVVRDLAEEVHEAHRAFCDRDVRSEATITDGDAVPQSEAARRDSLMNPPKLSEADNG